MKEIGLDWTYAISQIHMEWLLPEQSAIYQGLAILFRLGGANLRFFGQSKSNSEMSYFIAMTSELINWEKIVGEFNKDLEGTGSIKWLLACSEEK